MEDQSSRGNECPWKRPDARSVATMLRGIRSFIEEGPPGWDVGEQQGERLSLQVASTPELRERVFRLGARMYKQMGYLPKEGPEMLVDRFDLSPENLILAITGASGEVLATLTLIFDSEKGLPLDQIYRLEADRLRARHKRLAEIVRFAADERIRSHSKSLLCLFNFAYIYSKHQRNCDDLMITVHPDHASFYRRTFGFEQLGTAKPCLKVQGAPAVLLHLCFDRATARVKDESGRLPKAGVSRSWYTSACFLEAEPLIAAFLENRRGPMGWEEMERLLPVLSANASS